MAFAKFDPNNKPATGGNEWQKLPNGEYRQKLKDDCKPFDCEVEVLEATSYMKYQNSDNSTYEHLVLNLGLVKNGQVSETYHRVDIKGGKVINGISNITNRIYNIFALATTQRQNATDVLGQVTKYDFNKNEQTHDLLNMAGLRFRVIIATTGQYNGYNTYTTYFFNTQKQSYEEMIAGDTSLTAFNKGVEKITEARAKYMSETQSQGYGNGYGQSQSFGNSQAQGYSNGTQGFSTNPPQNVANMKSMQGVATTEPNTALDDDLPF